MSFPKFKLVNSRTKEVIGYEYLTLDGWKNDVFDFGERDGSFDQRELGDGLGVVHRLQSTGLFDKNASEVFVGDIIDDCVSIRWVVERGSFEFFFCGESPKYLEDGESMDTDISWFEAADWLKTQEVVGSVYVHAVPAKNQNGVVDDIRTSP